jgi:hypothetical protein
VFGCLCFPHIRPYNQHKFQQRSSPCVYLGVSPQHKGHKCLDNNGRVYISKDVIFHEFQFPYNKLFSTAAAADTNVSLSTVFFDPLILVMCPLCILYPCLLCIFNILHLHPYHYLQTPDSIVHMSLHNLPPQLLILPLSM